MNEWMPFCSPAWHSAYFITRYSHAKQQLSTCLHDVQRHHLIYTTIKNLRKKVHLVGSYYANISRCTVHIMSNVINDVSGSPTDFIFVDWYVGSEILRCFLLNKTQKNFNSNRLIIVGLSPFCIRSNVHPSFGGCIYPSVRSHLPKQLNLHQRLYEKLNLARVTRK